MNHLGFLKELELKRKPSPVEDFWECARHGIPEVPGVYILIAEHRKQFQYPAAKSPVYYIGRTKSLFNRLVNQHLVAHSEAYENRRRKGELYEPRHEYGAVFGERYCYILTWQGLAQKELEDRVLGAFATMYRAFPVANSAGSWNRIKMDFNRLAV